MNMMNGVNRKAMCSGMPNHAQNSRLMGNGANRAGFPAMVRVSHHKLPSMMTVSVGALASRIMRGSKIRA